MIALQTLKYKIFEWCLDTFLDKILLNFNKIPIDISGLIRVEDLQVGMKLSKIELNGGFSDDVPVWDIFKDCEILKIYKRNADVGLLYEITFKYRTIYNIGINLEDVGIGDDEIGKINEIGYAAKWLVDPIDQWDTRFYL